MRIFQPGRQVPPKKPEPAPKPDDGDEDASE